MVITDGGKFELIAQIYGLCTRIDLWYEKTLGNDSLQFGIHNSLSLLQVINFTKVSSGNVWMFTRNFTLDEVVSRL